MTHEKASDRAGALPRFSLRRRVTVLMMLASALVLGSVATVFIPLELIPRGFQEPFLRIWVPYQDAPAEEIVEKIVRPLEEELATIGGLDSMNAFASTGFGRIFLRFKQGTDMDVAYREARDRVERAKARIPEDVERVLIGKDDDTGIPVAMYGLTIDPSITDSHDLIQNEVVLPLQRLEGVATVDVQGQVEKEILIELDREKTASAGLNIYELAQELERDNFTLASGQVRSGDRKLLLRSVARYDDLEALRNRRVGRSLRLRDIATVKHEEPERDFRVRAMSLPAVAVQIFKEGDANSLAVGRRVAREVERLQANPRLGNLGMTTLFNQSEIIVESLDTLLDSGKIGGLFAVLVLFFFLRRFRMTLIITLSIPLSILVAVTAMYFAGETLNIISLLGLMISVGLLVDNSVVVAENIYRMHKAGRSRQDACVEGATEIALAITMATLTTIIVFLPASLVEGQGQFFLIRLAMPISISLAASLLVALVLIPLAVYLTLSEDREAKTSWWGRWHGRVDRVLARAYDGSFERLNDGYTKVLDLASRRRLDMVVALLVVFVGTMALFGRWVEFVEVQEEEQQGFYVEVELPQDTSFPDAEQFFLEMEAVVEGRKDRYGLEGWFIFHRATVGEIQGWFGPERESEMTPREITEDLLEVLPEKPGVRYYTGQESGMEEEDESTFRLTLYGDDPAELDRVADGLEERVVAMDGVLGVKKSADRAAEEIGLVVDRDRAQRLGVDPRAIAGLVGYALRGQALPRYSWEGREIPVRVRYREEDRASLRDLEDFQIPTGEGEIVSLRSLTESRFLPSSRQIWREDRRTSRSVSFELEEGTETATKEALQRAVARYDLPEGVRLDRPAGRGMNEELQSLLFALGLSVVFIYLLMAFLFESFVLPLSIIFTIPLAFIGVAWGHLIAGLDIDFLGAVGVILLIGVVVNNGIVLIDYANRLRDEGRDRREAILLAAHRRFRPIMMTALTTICGMIPLLLAGATSIGLSYSSFAIALIGGLITATLLTLLVVPVFYTLFDDLREYLIGVLAWGRRRIPSGSRRGETA